jgi:hypothetical protein
MRKVFGIKVDEFAEASIFSLAWTAGLTSAYVAYFGRDQVFLAAAIFLFISSVGMYYFLKLEAYQKAKREAKRNGESAEPEQEEGQEPGEEQEKSTELGQDRL